MKKFHEEELELSCLGKEKGLGEDCRGEKAFSKHGHSFFHRGKWPRRIDIGVVICGWCLHGCESIDFRRMIMTMMMDK